MGIEALSRGAAHCTFLDLRKEAVGVMRENLKRTGFAEEAAVIQGDYLAFLTRCKEKFDLIFLDPPYGTGMLEKAMEIITEIDIVSEKWYNSLRKWVECGLASGKGPLSAAKRLSVREDPNCPVPGARRSDVSSAQSAYRKDRTL